MQLNLFGFSINPKVRVHAKLFELSKLKPCGNIIKMLPPLEKGKVGFRVKSNSFNSFILLFVSVYEISPISPAIVAFAKIFELI